jgi:hypothetical protein
VFEYNSNNKPWMQYFVLDSNIYRRKLFTDTSLIIDYNIFQNIEE